MEEWTSTDLHHAINSTPSDDELADIIEDIDRIMRRKETELQRRWVETKTVYFRQMEEEIWVLVQKGGGLEVVEEVKHRVAQSLISERFALARKLEILMREERRRRTAAIEYVAQKEGLECRRLLCDPDESATENSVLVCDTEYTEQRGLTFVPDLVFDSVDDGFEGCE